MATGKNTSFAWELQQNLATLIKPRTDLIALFILSILKVGTVNLVKIAIGMGTDKMILNGNPEMFKIVNNGRAKISLFKAGFDELLDILLNGLSKRFNLIFKFLPCA
jgi:hypothetical protein